MDLFAAQGCSFYSQPQGSHWVWCQPKCQTQSTPPGGLITHRSSAAFCFQPNPWEHLLNPTSDFHVVSTAAVQFFLNNYSSFVLDSSMKSHSILLPFAGFVLFCLDSCGSWQSSPHRNSKQNIACLGKSMDDWAQNARPHCTCTKKVRQKSALALCPMGIRRAASSLWANWPGSDAGVAGKDKNE